MSSFASVALLDGVSTIRINGVGSSSATVGRGDSGADNQRLILAVEVRLVEQG